MTAREAINQRSIFSKVRVLVFLFSIKKNWRLHLALSIAALALVRPTYLIFHYRASMKIEPKGLASSFKVVDSLFSAPLITESRRVSCLSSTTSGPTWLFRLVECTLCRPLLREYNIQGRTEGVKDRSTRRVYIHSQQGRFLNTPATADV